MTSTRIAFPLLLLVCALCGSSAKVGGWDTAPNTQYHIQTDEGPERYFKYQTISGQYRKERRLQDGSVVGTYGWVDANGLLRLRDYVADNKGYRIVRTKTVNVGRDTPVGKAVSSAKKSPSQGGTGIENRPPTNTPAPIALSDYLKEQQQQRVEQTTAAPPISLSDYLKTSQVDVIPNSYSDHKSPEQPSYYTTPAPPQTVSDPTSYYSATPSYVEPVTYRPFYNPNSLDYNNKLYESVGAGRYETAAASSNQFPLYDGVAFTHNGFRYYLPRHYHEEENLPGESKAGSFGYIDPFGIRRVIYYNASPESGFVHRKNNRYVGFQATPYDPRL